MVASFESLNNMSMNLYGRPYMPYVLGQSAANGYSNYYTGAYQATPSFQSVPNSIYTAQSNYGYTNPTYTTAYGNTSYSGYGANYSNYPNYSAYQTPQVAQTYSQPQASKKATTSVAFTAAEQEALKDFYKKENSMEQDWSGIPMSMAMIALMEQTQTMLHPINSCTAIKKTQEILNLSNPKFAKAWKEMPDLAQDLFTELNAVNRNAKGKIPVLQRWFVKPNARGAELGAQFAKEAIEEGTEEAYIKAIEKIKASKGCDGYIPSFFARIKAFVTGKEYKAPTPDSRLAAKAESIEKAVKDKLAQRTTTATASGATATASATAAVTTTAAKGFNLASVMKGALKQGVKEGKAFAIFGLLIDLPKIITSYKEGGFGSALKQTAQTGVRSVIDGIGWTVGRAAGTALGTKLGTAIGTAICPGVGTAIGGVIGFLGGAVGSILASKISHAIIPTDEATKIGAEKATKTEEGKQELLKMVMNKAQSGEQLDPQVLQAAQKMAMQYGAVA